jgi:hypothetical protein
MSALFEMNTGIIDSHVNVNRTLELRQTPHLRLEKTYYPPVFNGTENTYGYDYVALTLEELYTNLTTNWMYSAVIEATLDVPGPAWTKDEWSFVPIDFSHLENVKETYYSENSTEDEMSTKYSAVNVTTITPAIRARLECTPTDDVTNTTWWLTQNNYTDYDTNQTTEVNSLDYIWNFGDQTANYSTALAPDGQFIQCCFNQTDPSRIANWSMPLLVAYWTNNFGLRYGERSVTGENGNITVKWIYGDGGFESRWAGSRPPVMFPNPPRLQSLNCMPFMETTDAEVTVDKETGRTAFSKTPSQMRAHGAIALPFTK